MLALIQRCLLILTLWLWSGLLGGCKLLVGKVLIVVLLIFWAWRSSIGEEGLRSILNQLLLGWVRHDVFWLSWVSRKVLVNLLRLYILTDATVFILYRPTQSHLRGTLHHQRFRGSLASIRGAKLLLTFHLLNVQFLTAFLLGWFWHVGAEDRLISHRCFNAFHILWWTALLTALPVRLLLTQNVVGFLSYLYRWWRVHRWTHVLPPLTWTRILLVRGLTTAWGAYSFSFSRGKNALVVIWRRGGGHRILGWDIFSYVAAFDSLINFWSLRVTYLVGLTLLLAAKTYTLACTIAQQRRLARKLLSRGRWWTDLHFELAANWLESWSSIINFF